MCSFHSVPPWTAGQYSRRPIKSSTMEGLFIMKAMASVLKQRGRVFGSTQGQSPAQADFLLLAKEQQCWRSQDLLMGSTIRILLCEDDHSSIPYLHVHNGYVP